MRTLIVFFSLFLLSFSLTATPALSERLAPMKKGKLVAADFTQVRTIADLEMTITIKGNMVFEREGRLLWQAKEPVRTLTIISGKELQNYDYDTGKVVTLAAKKFPWLTLLRESFTDTFAGDPETLKKRFDIREESQTILELLPKDPLLTGWVQKIRITFRPDFTAVEKVEILEKSGDKLEITYSNIKIDPVLPETIWELPPKK